MDENRKDVLKEDGRGSRWMKEVLGAREIRGQRDQEIIRNIGY